MATTGEPINLNQLSIYFDGVCWDLFPTIPLVDSWTFYKQDSETYEQFTIRIYALCDEMNKQLIFSLKRRIDRLEKMLHTEN